ncbi:hypothetical protein N8A98_22295 [Devosia neptuniae]|uniref:Uncharacterized protein n=1 Tax=Devosia neptuniae TaxID=191302 RepID=A0ABY6CCD2_9HYPH|nr:hypothetical protein [Devosia neptuniae]UXN69904.1 hypothetical protein N8A98_22295 [Devosia neptuniae]
MKQIDQDPGAYRFQKPDGSWGQRVDKRLCRWMGIGGLVVAAWFGTAYARDGGDPISALLFVVMGFVAGALITLSLKSLNFD